MKMLANVKLSPHKYKTSEGYLLCQDCIIGRTGAQTYLRSEIYENDENGNEYVDINRSEKEVFDPKTLASFENKPLTIEHPDGSVNPSNYKTLAVGNVHNVHKGEFEGEPVMYADIVVYDAEAIEKIESGEMVELSCGYDCDITDGPNPEQINIRGNHVALCEQGRAGIARIQDSKKDWGAKPIKDSVTKGSLIQEFGKQGKQYKIEKIVGNVIYANCLLDDKLVLFKKDEENIEWATITKSEVRDSSRDSLRFYNIEKSKSFEEEIKDFIKNLGEEIIEDVRFDYTSGYIPREHKSWVILIPYNSEYDKVEFGTYNSESEDRVLDKLKEEFTKAGYKSFIENNHGHIKVYEKSKVQDSDEGIKKLQQICKEIKRDLEWPEHDNRSEEAQKNRLNSIIKQIKEKTGLDFKVVEFENVYGGSDEEGSWYWPTYHLQSDKYKFVISFSGGYNQYITFEDFEEINEIKDDMPRKTFWIVNHKRFDDKEKAVNEARKLKKADKLLEFTECWTDEYDYPHETDLRRTLQDKEIKDYSCAQRLKELKAKKFEQGYLDEEDEEEYWYCKGVLESEIAERNYLNGLKPGDDDYKYVDSKESLIEKDDPKIEEDSYSEFYNELFDEINKVKNCDISDEEYQGHNKIYIYDLDENIDWENFKEIIFDLAEKHNISIKRFGSEKGWYDGEKPIKKVYTVIIENKEKIKDSKKEFIIALESPKNESIWLDENDKPTNEYNKAKRFNSYEEADSHRKTYCHGSVQEIKDECSLKDEFDPEIEAREIEKLLEGIEHGKIEESWGSLTIDFDDRSELNEAAKILDRLYDIELFREDPEELYIAVYTKYDKPMKGVNFVEDSEWRGFNLKKGRPAEDFKQYLRDRGFEFEPSENGKYIHFEVKNPDEDVEKEIEAIVHHYLEVGVEDGYSKKFYIKALKSLEDKLKKLEKNELLDSNQEDYEIQKNKMRETIKTQMEEYKKKLEEYE